MEQKKRRYDLDWLRVIAILAVYLHHIGMPFNGDQFHIMNNESSKVLDDIMVFFEQFRLPLLFLISGTGTMFAFSKRSWLQFVKERSVRLLIPLIFGVLFIVPPQTYFENISAYTSYFQLYQNSDFEVNHLWFIENLFIISVALIPLILFLRSHRSKPLMTFIENHASKRFGVLLWVVPLIAIAIITKQFFPGDSKDITNLSATAYYGFFFVTGMVFASSKHIWTHLRLYRRFNLVALALSIIIFYSYYFMPGELIEPYLTIGMRWNIWYAVCALVGWTLVITLLGYGQMWLNKRSLLLQKSNEAIYPFYILHQTIIVVFGYYIIRLDFNIPLKMGLLILTSFPIILLIYRLLIYPYRIPRLLFGMKKKV